MLKPLIFVISSSSQYLKFKIYYSDIPNLFNLSQIGLVIRDYPPSDGMNSFASGESFYLMNWFKVVDYFQPELPTFLFAYLSLIHPPIGWASNILNSGSPSSA